MVDHHSSHAGPRKRTTHPLARLSLLRVATGGAPPRHPSGLRASIAGRGVSRAVPLTPGSCQRVGAPRSLRGPPSHRPAPCVSVGGAICVGRVDATRRPLRRPHPHRLRRSASGRFRVVARARGSPRASAIPPAPSVPTAGHDGVPLSLARHGAAAALL